MINKNLFSFFEIFQTETSKKKSYYFIGILILLNLLFKFWNLSDASIWCDEAHSVYTVSGTFSNLLSIAKGDQNPPFYNFILFFWTKIFGISEMGIRSLSVFLSIGTVVFLYVFARKFFNNLIGIFASLFFTISNIQLYYSHEARSFVLVSFLCIWSFWVFLKFLEEGKWRQVFLLGILNACLLYTHFLSFFILIVQGIIFLIYLRENKKYFLKYLNVQLVCLFLFAPWLINLLKAIPESGTYWLKSPQEFKEILGIFISFYDIGILLGYTLGLFVVLAFLELWKGKIFERKIFLLFLWTFLPILLCFLIAKYLTPVFLPRYLLYTTLGMYLLLSTLIIRRVEMNVWRWILIAPILILGFIRLNLNPYKGEDWKASVAFVESVKAPEDIVLIEAWWQHKPFMYYYNRDWFADVQTLEDSMKVENIYAVNGSEILDGITLKDRQRIILVLSHQQLVDPQENLLGEAIRRYRVLDEENFEGVKVYTFEAKE